MLNCCLSSYPHIGYDINGKKIMRPATGDALQSLLDSIEVPKGWTGLTDVNTGNPLNLTYVASVPSQHAQWALTRL
jgi:hypothetical protein